ncbi:MAG: 3-deoxy-8-phosphooctulonate synthase [Saprospiraceae bacterium]|nr:3-deoxy-8-phosphooctulonate synthase [Saprospiraceae bacterium]
MNLYTQLQQVPFFILGPCVIESEELLVEVAEKLQLLEQELGVKIIFKASFDKANRTSIDSFRGLGMEEGLRLLAKIKSTYGFPILTDVHESHQVAQVAEVVDIIQIPAFLCRQTDLLVAAGQSGKIVNVKKAQFLSAKDMVHVVHKIESTGNQQILLTERGTVFGYNNLVVDFVGILEMMDLGYPVIMDATHSVQKPGAGQGKSLGNSQYAPHLANAAAAIGVKGFFMETHPNTGKARSDGANMIPLNELDRALRNINSILLLNLNNK